jgi:hypothetical protein
MDFQRGGRVIWRCGVASVCFGDFEDNVGRLVVGIMLELKNCKCMRSGI